MPEPRYRYDVAAGRYRDKRGRFVSNVRGELDKAIESSAGTMRAATASLREGGLSLEAWRATMQAEIKATHLASAALAKGGLEQMTLADYGRVGGIVGREYRYLEAFTQGMASGDTPLDGRVLQRAEQYIKAGRETYHRTERAERAVRGNDEERSVLNPADHCDMCVEEAGRGWQPIGTIAPIGTRTCRHNCKCKMEFRSSAA